MKKLLAVLGACLLGCTVFVSNGFTQTRALDGDQIYQQYRAAESRFSLAVSLAVSGKGPKEDANCAMAFFGDCPPLNEMFRLRETLKARADAGDSGAMFYTALLKVEQAEQSARASLQRDAANEFESALGYYKRAGDGGEIGGYWNVALMYADGKGVIQSKSAAVEWFYKAGTAYLSAGLREKALAALDAIKAIDKEHRLGKRLQTALDKGEPK